jgi:hypothetical protein
LGATYTFAKDTNVYAVWRDLTAAEQAAATFKANSNYVKISELTHINLVNTTETSALTAARTAYGIATATEGTAALLTNELAILQKLEAEVAAYTTHGQIALATGQSEIQINAIYLTSADTYKIELVGTVVAKQITTTNATSGADSSDLVSSAYYTSIKITGLAPSNTFAIKETTDALYIWSNTYNGSGTILLESDNRIKGNVKTYNDTDKSNAKGTTGASVHFAPTGDDQIGGGTNSSKSVATTTAILEVTTNSGTTTYNFDASALTQTIPTT